MDQQELINILREAHANAVLKQKAQAAATTTGTESTSENGQSSSFMKMFFDAAKDAKVTFLYKPRFRQLKEDVVEVFQTSVKEADTPFFQREQDLKQQVEKKMQEMEKELEGPKDVLKIDHYFDEIGHLLEVHLDNWKKCAQLRAQALVEKAKRNLDRAEAELRTFEEDLESEPESKKEAEEKVEEAKKYLDNSVAMLHSFEKRRGLGEQEKDMEKMGELAPEAEPQQPLGNKETNGLF